MVALRASLRRALARADWAADAFWSARSDDAALVARVRAREALVEVDALYGELRGVLASVAA